MKLPIVHGLRTNKRVKFCPELQKKDNYSRHLLISHTDSCYNWQGIYAKCEMKGCEYCKNTDTLDAKNKLSTYEADASICKMSYAKSDKKFNVEFDTRFCIKCNSHTCKSIDGPEPLSYPKKSLKKQSKKQQSYAMGEIKNFYIE